jgi:hypothetical protein
MKRFGFVIALGLLAMSLLFAGSNIHLEKYFLQTTWDSTAINATASFVRINATWLASPGSDDTLWVAFNNDTSASKRFKVMPSTSVYVTMANVKYIKVKAGTDSVKAWIDIN